MKPNEIRHDIYRKILFTGEILFIEKHQKRRREEINQADEIAENFIEQNRKKKEEINQTKL